MLMCVRDVGLGYMQLGQASTTLSGGEAQRIKLATELGNRSTNSALYVLDEPTTGLHFDDVRKLLEVLNRLADAGHTLIVIEHNLDVIKCADWIIDLGPEGGDRGGEVLATGTPETVAQNSASATGIYLRRMLDQNHSVMDSKLPEKKTIRKTEKSKAKSSQSPPTQSVTKTISKRAQTKSL
jgi:excinuclease ABC subunit A